jgi:hypothetical protein
LFLDVSELGLDAELIVTALFLPEGLQVLSRGLGEGKVLSLDVNGGFAKFGEFSIVQFVGRKCNITLILVCS